MTSEPSSRSHSGAEQPPATAAENPEGTPPGDGAEGATSAVLGKSLPLLALPLIVSFTARFFFAQIDLVFAVGIGDTSWVAAIGYYQAFQMLFIAVWVGLSGGYTAALSHAFGVQDETRVVALKATISRILAVLIPGLTLLGASVWWLVPHLGLEADLQSSFRTYGVTMLIGMSLTGFWAIHPDSVVKAHQDMRSTMIAGLLSTGVNVALNFLFVLAFGWGLLGIALATIVSRFPALFYAQWRMNALERERLSDPQWDKGPRSDYRPPLSAILTLAVPGALTFVLSAIEVGLVYNLLGGETVAIAALGVYQTVERLALMPTIACAAAVVPFAARLLPRGEVGRIYRDLGRTLVLACAFALLVTVVLGIVFGEAIAREMLDDATDPEQFEQRVALATRIFQLLPLAVLAAAPFLILRPMFEAAQRPRLGIRVSVVRFLALSIPLVLIGRFTAPLLGLEELTGIILGLVVATAGSSLMTWVLVRAQLQRVCREGPA